MRGSEKQIRWANDIIARVCGVLNGACEQVKDNPNEVKMYDRLITSIKGADYAGDVIDMFADYTVTGNLQRDFNSLIGIYRFYGKNGTDAQKKILGR